MDSIVVGAQEFSCAKVKQACNTVMIKNDLIETGKSIA
jgi:hypothetical protein